MQTHEILVAMSMVEQYLVESVGDEINVGTLGKWTGVRADILRHILDQTQVID